MICNKFWIVITDDAKYPLNFRLVWGTWFLSNFPLVSAHAWARRPNDRRRPVFYRVCWFIGVRPVMRAHVRLLIETARDHRDLDFSRRPRSAMLFLLRTCCLRRWSMQLHRSVATFRVTTPTYHVLPHSIFLCFADPLSVAMPNEFRHRYILVWMRQLLPPLNPTKQRISSFLFFREHEIIRIYLFIRWQDNFSSLSFFYFLPFPSRLIITRCVVDHKTDFIIYNINDISKDKSL